ncbi:MAG: DUF418 domain-containing protein [Myxococcota bacterium]
MAVLAIFVTNIKMMGSGYNHYVDRSLWATDADRWIGYAQRFLIDGKFVAIFTALFGAGLALLYEKKMSIRVILRRLGWLMAFGLAHMVLIREGDILFWYAVAGGVALVFVSLRPRDLTFIGVALLVSSYFYFSYVSVESSVPVLWQSSPTQHVDAAKVMLGSYQGIVAARLEAARYYIYDLFVLGGVWIETVGVMILGMALHKSGFLAGRLPARVYGWAAGAGAIIAVLPFVLIGIEGYRESWPVLRSLLNYANGYSGGLAWSALLILAMKSGLLAPALCAAGRMAFTIYILQSIVGLVLFSSLGFGLFGELSLATLMAIVGVCTAGFAAGALWWLRRYRFGPLEWLWRSLSYGTLQPMRREASSM